jgi:hypothetical protein
MKNLIITGTVALLCSGSLFANLEISLAASETSSPNKAIVTLSAKNTFPQPIRSAKAWVFAMDADGKVVGHQSSWIIAPAGNGQSTSGLDADAESEFNIVLNTERNMVSSKVTFTKIILADGTSVDPKKHVISLSDAKK